MAPGSGVAPDQIRFLNTNLRFTRRLSKADLVGDQGAIRRADRGDLQHADAVLRCGRERALDGTAVRMAQGKRRFEVS